MLENSIIYRLWHRGPPHDRYLLELNLISEYTFMKMILYFIYIKENILLKGTGTMIDNISNNNHTIIIKTEIFAHASQSDLTSIFWFVTHNYAEVWVIKILPLTSSQQTENEKM